MGFHNFSLVLERGRPAAKRVLVGSDKFPVIQQAKPDLILSGETREWETVERVRDGLAIGQKTSLLILSHSVSEEAGMEYAAAWLRPKVPGIKITHIPSNSPFTFV